MGISIRPRLDGWQRPKPTWKRACRLPISIRPRLDGYQRPKPTWKRACRLPISIRPRRKRNRKPKRTRLGNNLKQAVSLGLAARGKALLANDFGQSFTLSRLENLEPGYSISEASEQPY